MGSAATQRSKDAENGTEGGEVQELAPPPYGTGPSARDRDLVVGKRWLDGHDARAQGRLAGARARLRAAERVHYTLLHFHGGARIADKCAKIRAAVRVCGNGPLLSIVASGISCFEKVMPNTDTPQDRVYDPTAGKEAFAAIESQLRAMPPSEIGTLNVDLRDGATVALALVANARAPERAERIAILPESLLPKRTTADLEQAAWAAWYCHTQVLSQTAATTGGRVDPELYQESGLFLDRVLKLLDYHVGHLPAVAREIADIRSGVGYQDRATDLVRAAALLDAHQPELEGDTRRYQRGDAAAARDLARQIVGQLQESASAQAISWSDLRTRAFSRMAHLYESLPTPPSQRQDVGLLLELYPAIVAMLQRCVVVGEGKLDAGRVWPTRGEEQRRWRRGTRCVAVGHPVGCAQQLVQEVAPPEA